MTKRAAFRDWDYWGRPVPGFGDPQARLVIVGLAPAAHGANRTGRMFTGDRSGDWLYQALFRAGFANQATSRDADDGLEVTDCYITAIVHCAPPKNQPTAEERTTCAGWLDRELDVLPSAQVVVALGQLAYNQVLRRYGSRAPRPRPRFAHGLEVRLGEGGPLVIASYHPSQQNTFTGRLTEEMLDEVFGQVNLALGR
ncbi:MAG: uracil-DNA glycosylase [bacterium]|nr:uracil-DNA glycosylase [bacterium]